MDGLSFFDNHTLDSNYEPVLRYLQGTEWSSSGVTNPFLSPSQRSSCSSPLSDYTISLAREMGMFAYATITENNLLLLPYAYRHFIDSNSNGEYFGANGEYTSEIQSRHSQNQQFWDSTDRRGELDTNDVLLLGMHGSDMSSDAKLVPTLQLLYGMSQRDARITANDIQNFIRSIPRQYENPLLTLNAIATQDVAVNGDLYPNSITVGDGVLEFVKYQNLDSYGPEFIHSHEFAHHIQFDANLISGDTYLDSPSTSRRAELMADALSAYFLAHKDGGNLPSRRIMDLHEAAFSLGDCQTNDSGHHGTPSQRACASEWGARQATTGNRLSPRDFQSDFDSDLRSILRVSVNTCPDMQTIVPPSPSPPPPSFFSAAYAVGPQVNTIMVVVVVGIITLWL